MTEKRKTIHTSLQSDASGILNKADLPQAISETDFWTDVPEVVKQAIQKAKKQLDRGEGIAHDEVMKKMKSRFIAGES